MDISEIRYRNAKHLSDSVGGVEACADKMGKGQPQMTHIVGKKPTKNIGPKIAREFEKAFNKPKDWLDHPHPELWSDFTLQLNDSEKTPNYVLGGFDVWDSKTPLGSDEVELPFFREIELSAGGGRHEVIENHGRKLRFAKSTLKSKGINPLKAACVTVSGNSMYPVMPNGCTVGIDTGSTDIKDGDVYAIEHHGELRVKLLYKLPANGLRVRSYNTDEYPDEMYSHEEASNIKVLGRMFWCSWLV